MYEYLIREIKNTYGNIVIDQCIDRTFENQGAAKSYLNDELNLIPVPVDTTSSYFEQICDFSDERFCEFFLDSTQQTGFLLSYRLSTKN